VNACCRSAPQPARPIGRLFRLTLAVGSLLLAVWAVRAESPKPAEIAGLVRKLASDDFDERESASKRLLDIDEDGLIALRKEPPQDDAEVNRRLRDIIRTVEKRLYGEEFILTGHSGHVVSVSASRDGEFAVSAGNDTTIRLWELTTGREVRRLAGPGRVEYWSVAFSPDGKRALGGGSDGSLTLWDVETGETVKKFPAHPGACRSIAFTPDGKMALTGCYDHTGRLWDLETGSIVHRFLGHQDSIMCVAVSADGRLGVTGGAQSDRTLRLWDLTTGEEVQRFEGHTERIMGVRFSPDCKRIASGCWDGTVRLWNIAAGAEERRLEPGAGAMHGVDFTADSKRLVAAGGNGSLVVWDVATGKLLTHLTGHEGKVGEVVVIPGRIVSGAVDASVRVWRMPR
jgi:WD40 repeat protein